MMIYHQEIEKKEINPGVFFQYLGKGERMNVFHWNMAAGKVVAKHSHESEQFGYVLKGGFVIEMEDKKFEIGQGDAYFIPSNVEHSFVSIGDTEAIDVFYPIKSPIPDGREA
ncbi:MAG: cupin domain-containing protein [Pelosinus sp.]|nr:cupin domain-containing protein [Pelosinus sp.]